MHLHVNRGKRSIAIDLKHPDGVALFEELVARQRRRGRGHAPGWARPAGPRLRPPPRAEPAHRVLHDLGVRGDRPLPGPREPRHRVRRLGRHLRARDRRGRVPVDPEPRLDRHQRRAAVRGARHPGRRDPGARAPGRAPSSRSRNPTAPRRSTGTARRPTGPTSDRSPRSPATPPTTTCGASRRLPACGVVSATRCTGRPTAMCCSWRASSTSGRSSATAVERPELFERWPGSEYGDHARGNREMQTELTSDLRDEVHRGVGPVRHRRRRARSRPATRRTRSPTIPSSGTASAGSRPTRSAPSSCRSRSRSSTPNRSCRPRRRPSASTPTPSSPTCSARRRPDCRPPGVRRRQLSGPGGGPRRVTPMSGSEPTAPTTAPAGRRSAPGARAWPRSSPRTRPRCCGATPPPPISGTGPRSGSATASGPTPSTSRSRAGGRTSSSTASRRAGRATSRCSSTTCPSTSSRSAGPRSSVARSSGSTTPAAVSSCCGT